VRALALALEFDLSRATNVALVIGVLVLGVGYALGQFRRGKDERTSATIQRSTEALNIAGSELDLLRARGDRLDSELSEAKERIARLEAISDAQQRENATLRALVMLETIPPALQAALEETGRVVVGTGERLHEETRTKLISELHATETRLAALFAERKG
jgi:hypothetical protein